MNQPRLITRTRSHQARTAAWLTLAFLIPLGFATAQSVPPSGYARAAQLIQEGNPTGAIAVIERLLRQSPQDVRAHNLMVGRTFDPYPTWARVSMARPQEMAYFVQTYKKLYG